MVLINLKDIPQLLRNNNSDMLVADRGWVSNSVCSYVARAVNFTAHNDNHF